MNEFQTIRTNARNNKKEIISFLENHYLIREDGKAKTRPAKSICIFCSTGQDITKEHVLPRWAFERHPDKTFQTMINGLSHKYNQTTLPACKKCNTHLLSKIESRVLELFSNHKLPNHSIHHQLDVHKYNFGDITWWDRMFGTFKEANDFAPECGFPNDNESKVWDILRFKDVYKS